MRKIHVGAQVSIDGIMQSPGGVTEDPTNGFTLGGWSMPYGDEKSGEEMGKLFAADFDLLLGRKTYEIFAAYWPFYDVNSDYGLIARRFNEVKKYVVTRSGDVDTSWENTVVLRDIEAVRHLRAQNGPTLLTQGSVNFVHSLFAHDLVDAMSLFTVPVVIGQGKKLWADGSAPHEYRLTGSVVASDGLVVTHFERGGAVRTDSSQLGNPSALELKRRERMEREG
jgi:dihydrofolate reductase